MNVLVLMSGGFHPFHPGHLALYNSAKQAFPSADVVVGATNSQQKRPFNFKDKATLATIAGVDKGHFVEVNRQFAVKGEPNIEGRIQNPDDTLLILVRSMKDANDPVLQPWKPNPDGSVPMTKGSKNNPPRPTSNYLLSYKGNEKQLQPMTKHAYIAFLPVEEFGPTDMTSATQIRDTWPTLNDRRKQAFAMSLYPATQKNSKLLATVVDIMNRNIGVVSEPATGPLEKPVKGAINKLKVNKLKEQIQRMRPLIREASIEQKYKFLKLMKEAAQLNELNLFGKKPSTSASKKPINYDEIRRIAAKTGGTQQQVYNSPEEYYAKINTGKTKEPVKEFATDDMEEGQTSDMRNFFSTQQPLNPAPIQPNNSGPTIARVTRQGESMAEGVNDPHIFKCILLFGPMGAGKSTVARPLLSHTGLRSVNLDNFNEMFIKKGQVPTGHLSPDQLEKSWQLSQTQQQNFTDGRLGIIIDGSGRNPDTAIGVIEKLMPLGYEFMMIFVNVSEATSIARQQSRADKQQQQWGVGRQVEPELAKDTYDQVQKNLAKYSAYFGPQRFVYVDNEKTPDLTQATKKVDAFLRTPVTQPEALEWVQTQKGGNQVAQQQKKLATAQDSQQKALKQYNPLNPKFAKQGVTRDELEELANTSLKVKEPKDFVNTNDRKQVTYKVMKFKSGKDTYLINFTVKGAPAFGKKQNWNAVNVAFGVREEQDDYSFGDEINTDLTAKNKKQFLIYSTVINAIRKFITEYNTEIDEIIMQGAGERQVMMYQRFFRVAPKYFPGWHYDGKHSLVRDVPRQTGKKIKDQMNPKFVKRSVEEGQLELNTPDPVVVIQDKNGKILDKLNLSVASEKYKLGQPQFIKKQLAHQNYTTIGNYVVVSPMSGQPQDNTTQGVLEDYLPEK